MIIQDLDYLEVISNPNETSAIQGRAFAFSWNKSVTLGAFGKSTTVAFASGKQGATASVVSGSASIAYGGSFFASAAGGIGSASAF